MLLFFYIFLLFISVLLESTLFTLPISLIYLICLAVIKQENILFIIALITGIILDSLLFRHLGVSSLFFVCVLAGIYLYKSKFEIRTLSFAILASMVSTGIYLWLFGYNHIMEQVLISGFYSGILFFLVNMYTQKQNV